MTQVSKRKPTSSKPCISCGNIERMPRRRICYPCYKKNLQSDPVKYKDYLARNLAAHKKNQYKVRYKITEDQYFEMLKSQGNCCAICLTHQDDLKIRMSVDHDHNCCLRLISCGKCVRGLLCRSCNLALGGFKDNKVIIENVLKYLNQYESGYIN